MIDFKSRGQSKEKLATKGRPVKVVGGVGISLSVFRREGENILGGGDLRETHAPDGFQKPFRLSVSRKGPQYSIVGRTKLPFERRKGIGIKRRKKVEPGGLRASA